MARVAGFVFRSSIVAGVHNHTYTVIVSTPVRSAALAVGRFIRAAWLLFGVTVAVWFGMESFYRAKRAISARIHRAPPPPVSLRDPEDTAAWYPEFTREYDALRPQRWQPYIYWGRLPNFHGTYINLDSAGHRITPQPSSPATPRARVFFFGGSTMWGTAQRDDHTIAAEASRRLQPLAGPGARIEVTNFGETGYTFTQEVLQLMLALREGARPDVVVFYDGINDVVATVQLGEPGLPQNEMNRANDFAVGRILSRTGVDQGLQRDARALKYLVHEAMQQFALVAWAQSLKRRPAAPFIPAERGAVETARAYVETMRWVEALGAQYHFQPVYVWQPTVHATLKVPTAYEQRLLRRIAADSFHHRQQEIHRLMPALLDSAARAVAPGRFVDAYRTFAGDSLPVFVDWIGHNTEISVPIIVDRFWPELQRAVTSAITRPAGSRAAARVTACAALAQPGCGP